MEHHSFAIHTLGCKVNTYESDAMAESLRASGFSERDFGEAADIYIINTCTVTNIADRKSRQMLRRARKINPDALIVAAGCYVDDAIKNNKLSELIAAGVIDLAVPNKDKGRACGLILEKLAEQTKICEEDRNVDKADECEKKHENADAADEGKTKSLFLTQLDGHTRAFIKVQDGCNMFCSYCIIPYVRGRLNSRPNEDTLKEVRALSDKGVAEVVITGIHLTSMGEQLLRLIEDIQNIEGIKRIRLGSLEPTLITEETVRSFKSFDKLCPHFHLSLQSGSDDILRKMNRHYTVERYMESCELLKKYYEHPAITTDIIVGFPGETEKDFEASCELAKRVGLYEAHVFKYSRRKGTPADTMENQITETVKAERSERLIDIAGKLSHEFRSYYIGKSLDFISEELTDMDGVTYETGYTSEYVRCLKKTDKLHANELISGNCLRFIHENGVDESLIVE